MRLVSLWRLSQVPASLLCWAAIACLAAAPPPLPPSAPSFGYPSPIERDLECRLTGERCGEYSYETPSPRMWSSGRRRFEGHRRDHRHRQHAHNSNNNNNNNNERSSHSFSAAHSLFDAERFDEAAATLNAMMEDLEDEEDSTDGPMSQTIARGRLMVGIVQERISTKARHGFGPAFSSLARYNLAVKALRTNSPEIALGHLDHVLQRAPTFAPALYNHGTASYQTGDLETALVMFSACNRSSVLSDGQGSDLAAAAARNMVLIYSREDGRAFAREHHIRKFRPQSPAAYLHRMLETAVRLSLSPLPGTARHRGLVLVELGVWRGDTLRRIAAAADGHDVYGFDSFLGLPGDFAGGQFRRGAFSTKGAVPARLPINAEVRPGWFNTTVASFVGEILAEDLRVSFVHVDCDLYASAKEALALLVPVLSSRAVLQFDQFIGYPGWRDGEARAWWDVAETLGVEFEYVWYEGMRVTVQLRKLRGYDNAE